MRKLIATLAMAALVILGAVANANPAVEALRGHGPSDGEFSAWTKQLANGTQIKFYAKYMQPGQKVQFMVQNNSGSYVQYAWERVDPDDLNQDGSYKDMQNHVYFIRTLDLKPGKNRVRILVDGEIIWGTKTYSGKQVEAGAPSWTQSASPADVEKCKIPDPRPLSEQLLYRGVRQGDLLGKDPVGFTDWIRDGLLPITGELNIIFARIAFDDAPPSPETVPDGYLEKQAKKMTDLGLHWSNGEFEYKFQVVDDWVQVPVNHADYPVSAGDDVDHSPEAYEIAKKTIEIVSKLIVESLPSDLDFDAADLVVPVWSTNITEFTMPVTWRGGGLRSPSGQTMDAIFMGNSTYMHTNLDYTWSVLGHDFLHLQGLNEHAPGPKFGTHIGGMTKPSYFGWSALMPAWETFLMNWFEDSQVHCITPSGLDTVEQVILTPLETLGGERKMIVIPTEDHKALVVESRRPVGYSSTWPKENSGLLVYEIDTNAAHLDHGENQCSNSRENPKWSYYLLPDGTTRASDCNNPAPYFVKPGMTLSHAGVKIKLVHSSDKLDYIQVTADLTSLDSSGFDGAIGQQSEANSTSFRGTRKSLIGGHCACCSCSALGG